MVPLCVRVCEAEFRNGDDASPRGACACPPFSQHCAPHRLLRPRNPRVMRSHVLMMTLLAGAHAGPEPSYTAPGQMHTGLRARVRTMDAEMLQMAVGRHRRFIVWMHDGADAATKAFQPWLYAIANLVPHLPFGTIDLSQGRGAEVAEAFKVQSRLPQIKLFVRDNPKGKRILDYTGPLEFDELFSWLQTVLNGQDHELSAYGVEPEGGPEPVTPADGGRNPGGARGGAMGQLPESVRLMAQTMVRETRLQRILKQHGGGRAEHYDAMVATKYRELIEEEKTDLGDKFAVQEVNRRARDAVRTELMVDAPLHIREEVEADVSLGDAANSMLPQGVGGEQQQMAPPKEEL